MKGNELHRRTYLSSMPGEPTVNSRDYVGIIAPQQTLLTGETEREREIEREREGDRES